MIRKFIPIKLLGALCLVFGGSGVNAALVNFELTANVDYAFPNVFGLSGSDTITATGVFDDSLLTGGADDIDFSSVVNNMTLFVGSETLTDADAVGGGGTLSLDGNAFVGLAYTSVTYGHFVSIGTSIVADNNNVVATWDGASFSMTPVPVPAALWLFGSGLLGLVGIARRRR